MMTTASNTRALTAEETAAVSGGVINCHLSDTQFRFQMMGVDFGWMLGSSAAGNSGWHLVWTHEGDPGTWQPLPR
jgi:hypothetical protein